MAAGGKGLLLLSGCVLGLLFPTVASAPGTSTGLIILNTNVHLMILRIVLLILCTVRNAVANQKYPSHFSLNPYRSGLSF